VPFDEPCASLRGNDPRPRRAASGVRTEGEGTGEREATTAQIQRTKLTPPRIGKGWIPRPRLTGALAEARDVRLLLLSAPVGYGKSGLLAEWREREMHRRPFAWLSLDEADSDPGRLFAHLIESIRIAVPDFGTGADRLLRSTGPEVGEVVVPILLEELAASRPLVIVLDDYHRPRSRRVHQIVERLIDGLPPTTLLALATRADPSLPTGRLRATGAMAELRAADLRFDLGEAVALVAASGVTLPEEDVADLVERTEGWPAGLYLAMLSLRTEQDPSGFVRRFAGTHRHVADYLSEEVLRRQPDATRAFLVRTSVLDRMCAGLCDAVLETSGSQAMLEELERSNLFVVPLDEARTWYRYHHLFGQMLRAELSRTDPEQAVRAHRRASRWFEAEGLIEEAVQHALAAGETSAAGDMIARHWFELFSLGRLPTLRRWLDGMGDDAIGMLPTTALVGAWVAALLGDPDTMERWLEVTERGPERGRLPDGTGSLASGVAIVRGLFGYGGLRARRADLARALELEPQDSRWITLLRWGQAHVALLSGDAGSAERLLEQALRGATPSDPISRVIVLSTLSLAKTDLGRTDEAIALAHKAEAMVEEWGLGADTRTSGVPLAIGRAQVAIGEVREGHQALERALVLRRHAYRLSPWPTLEVLAALAPVRFTLGDIGGAKELLDEARSILDGLEDAGDLPRRFDEAEHLLRRADRQVAFGEALTEREMAILRLLPTTLTQRQIGSELYLSVNTVKSHSRAIYRKLGVSSRAQAIEAARSLQLL
jgi:LuxR family maltose regulon positive regulatory protein